MNDNVDHDCASKNDLLTKWKRFDFVSIYMFNRDTEFFLKSKHSDVAKMRKRNETISKHHLSIIKRRFEYDIYRNTNITINSEIASFMKKLLNEDFAKFFRSKFFYKEMKIYCSIKILTKFVCQTKHYNIHNFTDFLIVSLRVKNSDSRYKRSNIKKDSDPECPRKRERNDCSSKMQ